MLWFNQFLFQFWLAGSFVADILISCCMITIVRILLIGFRAHSCHVQRISFIRQGQRHPGSTPKRSSTNWLSTQSRLVLSLCSVLQLTSLCSWSWLVLIITSRRTFFLPTATVIDHFSAYVLGKLLVVSSRWIRKLSDSTVFQVLEQFLGDLKRADVS